MHDDLLNPIEKIIPDLETLLLMPDVVRNQDMIRAIQTIKGQADFFHKTVIQNADAIAQMKSREAFYNISHETRTPLTGMLAYSDLMLLGAFGAIAEDTRAKIQEIRDLARLASDRMNEIFRNARSNGDAF